jgi:GT2 family glycosyltransferase
MGNKDVMVVLPTLGKRLVHLGVALESCSTLAESISLTLCVVAPAAAIEARKLAADRGAQLVDDPGTGMADAINAALSTRSSERYYVWLGDDDVLVPSGIERLIAALDADEKAVVAHGQCEYIDTEGATIALNRAGGLAHFLLAWGPNLIPHPGTVVSMDALEKVGGFSSGLSYALDLDVFLKLRKVGGFVAVPTVASRFRWHSESLTVADRRASSREAMSVKARHLPGWLRWMSPLWHWPIAWLSTLAAKIMNRQARKV